MQQSLASLVERAQAGEPGAFNAIAQRFHRQALSIARKCVGNVHDARDLAQNSWIFALERLGQLKKPAAFPGWFSRIIRNVAATSARRDKPLQGSIYLEQFDEIDEDATQTTIETNERQDEVRKALDQLKPNDRDVLEKHYLDGLGVKRIARRLDVPLGTVKRRLHVARGRLRKVLGSV